MLPWHISVSIVADNGPSDVYRRGPVPKTCVKFNKKPAVKCFKFMLTQTGAMFCEIDRLWVGEARGPKIDHNPPPTPPPRGGFRLGTVRKSVSKIKESLVDGVFGWIPRTHGVPTGECLHANIFFSFLPPLCILHDACLWVVVIGHGLREISLLTLAQSLLKFFAVIKPARVNSEFNYA